METRNIIGKRIVEIRQRRFTDRNRGPMVDVIAVVLENGTELRPIVHEAEDDYCVDFLVAKRHRS